MLPCVECLLLMLCYGVASLPRPDVVVSVCLFCFGCLCCARCLHMVSLSVSALASHCLASLCPDLSFFGSRWVSCACLTLAWSVAVEKTAVIRPRSAQLAASHTRRGALMPHRKQRLWRNPLWTPNANARRCALRRPTRLGPCCKQQRTHRPIAGGPTVEGRYAGSTSDARAASAGHRRPQDSKLCLWNASGVSCVDLTGHMGRRMPSMYA